MASDHVVINMYSTGSKHVVFCRNTYFFTYYFLFNFENPHCKTSSGMLDLPSCLPQPFLFGSAKLFKVCLAACSVGHCIRALMG